MSSGTSDPPLPQVLNNSYLLKEILSFFNQTTEPEDELKLAGFAGRIPFPDSQHLLWAALVSKGFRDPALEVLWHTLDSYVPLLSLLPVLKKDRGHLTADEIILDSHLSTMLRYAQMVRRFRVCGQSRSISPFIYGPINFLLASRNTTLIPALNILDISRIGDISNDHIHWLFLLPCWTITHIAISGFGRQETEFLSASLLQAIVQKSPQIQVKCLKLQGLLTSTSLNMINQFGGLESLRLDMQGTRFSREFLQGLCVGTNTLKQVCFIFDNSSTFPISSSPHISNFSYLKHMEIRSSAQIALMIWLYISAPNLSNLSVHFTSLGSDTNGPGKCLQRICEASQSLKWIQITSDDVQNAFVQGADLACLGLCPLLQHIDIVAGGLTAQTFLGYTGQWSSVRYMRLAAKKINGQPRTQNSQSLPLSLSQLPKILSLCPKLKTLLVSAVLDIGPAGTQTMRSTLSRTQNDEKTTKKHCLKELVFLPFPDNRTVLEDGAVATTSNAFVVSRFIRRILPHLQICDLSKLTDINRDWREGVQEMVKEL